MIDYKRTGGHQDILFLDLSPERLLPSKCFSRSDRLAWPGFAMANN